MARGSNWNQLRKLIGVAWFVLGWPLTACLGDEPGLSVSQTAAPIPTRNLRFPATVESIKLETMTKQVTQVRVVVRGALPDPCSAIDEVTQEREGATIKVVVLARRQSDVACDESRVEFEEAVELNVLGLPADIYIVDVNGLKGTFTIEFDNIADLENAVIGGRLWGDICPEPDSDLASARATMCRQKSDGETTANGRIDTGEQGIAGVTVMLGAGACPNRGLAATITDADGFYLFGGLKSGDYCVSINSIDLVNRRILGGGSWTSPTGATPGNLPVSIAPGEGKLDVDLGWSVDEPMATVEAPQPTAGICTDVAAFLEDVTIPDDTAILPGETFTKTWLLRNVGTCTWTEAYSLIFAEGDPLGSDERHPLQEAVAPGETAEVSIMLRLPEDAQAGTIRGSWKLVNDQGVQFGIGVNANQPFWVQIVVEE